MAKYRNSLRITPSTMRDSLFPLVLLGLSALGGAAWADASSKSVVTGSRQAHPRFSDLPSATLPVLRVADAPKGISAAERAEGFHVIRPKYGGRIDYAMVFASAAMAQSFDSGRGIGNSTEDGACLMSGVNMHHRSSAKPEEVQWQNSFQQMLSISNQPSGMVQPLRLERFVAGSDGRAQLQVTHAWVDVASLGTRLVSTGTFSFMRIATGPNGIEVYAAKSGDQVEILVANTMPSSMRGRIGGLQFQASNGTVGSQNGCNHIRFTLQAARDSADMITAQGDVSLGPAESEGKQTLLQKLAGVDGRQEMRIRPLRLGVSTSWTSRDTEPVISVSMGWAGKERVQ